MVKQYIYSRNIHCKKGNIFKSCISSCLLVFQCVNRFIVELFFRFTMDNHTL